MKTKPHAADRTSQRQPITSNALRNGGLTGAVILSGLLLACDGSGVTDVRAAVAAPTRVHTKTVAEPHFIFEQFDHAVVNQHRAAHDSDLPDLPGASIAEYAK